MNHFQTILRELRKHLDYVYQIITMRMDLFLEDSIQAKYIVLDAYCRKVATDFAERGLTTIKEISSTDLAIVRRDIEAGLRILQWEVEILNYNPPSSGAPAQAARRIPAIGGDEERPSGEPRSPPNNFDEHTMSDTLECPICYRRVAEKGFTHCKHRLCPHCLEQHVRNYRRSCPMCRQGEPNDNVLAEVARLLESLER